MAILKTGRGRTRYVRFDFLLYLLVLWPAFNLVGYWTIAFLEQNEKAAIFTWPAHELWLSTYTPFNGVIAALPGALLMIVFMSRRSSDCSAPLGKAVREIALGSLVMLIVQMVLVTVYYATLIGFTWTQSLQDAWYFSRILALHALKVSLYFGAMYMYRCRLRSRSSS